MKLIFLPLLTLLLSCSCSIGSESIQNEELKTKFVDMNFDVLYIILSRLELVDLLNSVEAFPGFSEPVGEVFLRKYPQLEIRLLSPVWDHPNQNQFYTDENRIEIYNFQMVLIVLKHFGNLFQTVKINAEYMEATQLQLIKQFLNKYCSETLKQLELKYIMNDAMDEFTVPFKAVEELRCDFNNKKHNNLNETQPWNQLFPQLRRLTLNMRYIRKVIDGNFIDCIFPRLEHFHLSLHPLTDAWVQRTEQIRSFIKKNPTIRHFELYFHHLGLIEFISQHLSQLENLTLTRSDYIQDDKIYFENVKNLFLYDVNSDKIDRFSFPHLNSLKMHIRTQGTETWMNFFRNHMQLKRLHLIEHSSKNEHVVPLNEYTADLSNLIDVSVEFADYHGVENIIQFVEGHGKLQKFRFNFEYDRRKFPANDLTILLNRLGNEWNIYSIEPRVVSMSVQVEMLEEEVWFGLSFEKKNLAETLALKNN